MLGLKPFGLFLEKPLRPGTLTNANPGCDNCGGSGSRWWGPAGAPDSGPDPCYCTWSTRRVTNVTHAVANS